MSAYLKSCWIKLLICCYQMIDDSKQLSYTVPLGTSMTFALRQLVTDSTALNTGLYLDHRKDDLIERLTKISAILSW